MKQEILDKFNKRIDDKCKGNSKFKESDIDSIDIDELGLTEKETEYAKRFARGLAKQRQELKMKNVH